MGRARYSISNVANFRIENFPERIGFVLGDFSDECFRKIRIFRWILALPRVFSLQA